MAQPEKHKARGSNDDFEILALLLDEMPALRRRVLERLRPVIEQHEERNKLKK